MHCAFPDPHASLTKGQSVFHTQLWGYDLGRGQALSVLRILLCCIPHPHERPPLCVYNASSHRNKSPSTPSLLYWQPRTQPALPSDCSICLYVHPLHFVILKSFSLQISPKSLLNHRGRGLGVSSNFRSLVGLNILSSLFLLASLHTLLNDLALALLISCWISVFLPKLLSLIPTSFLHFSLYLLIYKANRQTKSQRIKALALHPRDTHSIPKAPGTTPESKARNIP